MTGAPCDPYKIVVAEAVGISPLALETNPDPVPALAAWG
jgi:hypothetical protein